MKGRLFYRTVLFRIFTNGKIGFKTYSVWEDEERWMHL